MMKISIVNNIIQNNGVEIYRFLYNIKDYLIFTNRIVLLIYSPVKSNFNENIYCINEFGDLVWQIEKVNHIYEDSPYDRIVKIDNNTLEAWNYDSNNYLIDINTGKTMSNCFLK